MTLRFFAIAFFFLSTATSTLALDFYGANVTDVDAPSSYMRVGIFGYHPTVGKVHDGSQSAKYGFRSKDIILSINGKNVQKTSELNQFQTDVLSIVVFRGNHSETLTIDRLAIEKIKANRVVVEGKQTNTAISQINFVDDRQDDTSTLKFDNAVLEKKYGKTTPEQRAREYQRAAAENERNQKELRIRAEKQNAELRKIQAAEALKLAKTNCTGVPGECGTGRVCLRTTFMGKTTGYCTSEGEADRVIAENLDRNLARQEMRNRINQVEYGQQEIKREMDWNLKRRW